LGWHRVGKAPQLWWRWLLVLRLVVEKLLQATPSKTSHSASPSKKLFSLPISLSLSLSLSLSYAPTLKWRGDVA
jgi:hypothetical protein